jgi:inositol-hexakisphosphate 5-kinase
MDGASAANPEFTEPQEITVSADEPRIVSHQQQTGELAKVVLENNRHIFPPDLFGPPPRPRSADPTQSQIRHGSAPGHGPSTLSGYVSTPLDKMSPIRPPLTSSPASWGATTVNTKLREQVLREVFGPPMVHQQRRHNQNRNTLPRLRQRSERRQTNFSDPATFDARRSMGELSRMVAETNGTEATEDTQTRHRLEAGISVQARPTPDQDSSALIVEVDEPMLEKMKTAEDTELRQTLSNSHPIKRRHSGSGLRRRRSTVHGASPGDLEFFDEDHHVTDEDDIFRMDTPGSKSSKPPLEPSKEAPRDAAIPSDGGDSNEKPLVATADSESVKLIKPTPINGQELIRTPINPKEAQLNQLNPDERVQFFLLLENLTAGINKPCVLDLKMGTRQYGIEANEKKKRSQRRKCKSTTSSQLGVRLCGMQVWNVKKQKYFFEDKYQGRDLKAGREFQDALTRFLYDGVSNSSVLKHIPVILEKIAKLDNMIRRLPGYRFYASSLLLIYDGEPDKTPDDNDATKENDKEGSNGPNKKKDRHRKAKSTIDVKIVDFANCVTGEDKLPSDVPCPPHDLHAVDRGYLRGLRTLRMYFQRIMNEINSLDYVERGEGEGMAMGQSGAGTRAAPGEWSDNVMDDVGEVSL